MPTPHSPLELHPQSCRIASMARSGAVIRSDVYSRCDVGHDFLPPSSIALMARMVRLSEETECVEDVGCWWWLSAGGRWKASSEISLHRRPTQRVGMGRGVRNAECVGGFSGHLESGSARHFGGFVIHGEFAFVAGSLRLGELGTGGCMIEAEST